MADEGLDVGAGGSSTAATDARSAAPAGAENTVQQNGNQPQYKGFHEHPDWQRMVSERKQERAVLAQLHAKVAEYERAQAEAAKPAPGAPRTPEDQFARMQALAALKELIGEDADLKGILELAKLAPQLQGVTQHVNGLRSAQTRATVQAGHEAIRQLAKENNLPAEMVNGPAFDHLEDLVTGVFTRNPELAQRFLNGDRAAITEAWKKLDPFIGGLRQPAALRDTKANLQGLPPAPRGGAPGSPAPPKLDPANPKAFEKALHEVAGRALSEAQRG